MRLKVYKVRATAKLPQRAHSTDAGADLFYSPKASSTFNKEDIRIGPGASALIPTGLKVGVPEGFMFHILNKSSVAAKRQLITGAEVVDSGYDGEVFVNLHNIGDEVQIIEPGQKVAQGVLTPIITCEFEEIAVDNVYGGETSRGVGALGSTGDK